MGYAHFSPAPLSFIVCNQCGLAGVDHGSAGNALDYFEEKSYVERQSPTQYVHSPISGSILTAQQHQLELLDHVTTEDVAVLDIGCHDGRLLRALREKYPIARLVGYDLSNEYEKHFSAYDIIYSSNGLDKIEAPFDLITLVHSLQYKPDLSALFDQVKRLLSPHGHLYLQVPDVSKKPCALLLTDLYHHFTLASMDNLLAMHGFQVDAIIHSGFARDIVVRASVARKGVSNKPGARYHFNEGVSKLIQFSKDILVLKECGSFIILGTTIEAAFTSFLLGDKCAGFIDEAPGTSGTTFQGFKVRHPDELAVTESTLLPLGQSATKVLSRFSSTYNGSFTLV